MKRKSTPKETKISRSPHKTAAIYVRVSSKEQVDNYSIETQLKEIREFLTKQNIIEVGVFIEEGESAKTTNRTQFFNLEKFIKLNKHRVDHVVVYKVDRWARNQEDYHYQKAKLKQYGVQSILSATENIADSKEGRFLEGIYAALAQLDNENKGERTKSAMLTKALDGWFPAVAPYGYKNDPTTKRLVNDEKYYQPIKQGLLNFLNGKSIPQLVASFEQQGVTNKLGNPLDAKAVWKILDKSMFYAGKYTWKDYPDLIQGKHNPMITWQQHLQIQNKLRSKPHDRKPVDDIENTFVLNFSIAKGRGFLHCANCNNRLTHSRSKGNGGTYPYYYCNNSKCNLEKKSIIKTDLENMFSDLLIDITPNKEYVNLFNELLCEEWYKGNEQKSILQKQSQDRLADLERQKRGLIKMRAKGEIDAQDFAKEIQIIRTEIGNAQIMETDNQIDFKQLEKLLAESTPFLTNLEPHYNRLGVTKRRDMAQLIFPKGLTYAEGEFRTMQKAELFTFFDVLESGNVEEIDMVTLRGIEPRLPG